ncbi:MerR family transcriptional regulator [Pedobacter sp. L105]|uniref:MerR family transcriptional regulator n=1 Tax=Pedobacter sp. L105 TaxID=1641871 RepID=UPI00131C8AF4|nr:MerR family transcriptional regulator [Pedobacter sp. L105]
MLINELSKRTGVTIHTLRYYENLGLIKGNTDETVKSNTYKQYDEILVETLSWIIASKKAGFSLAEINTLLQEWFDEKLTLSAKVEIVDKKINEVDLKIKQLKEVKKFLLEAKKDVEKGLC